MQLTIREMEKGEAGKVREIGRPSFGLLESLMFSKPKAALVAEIDNEIVGATSYRIFEGKNNEKIGYVEVAYVKKGFEGRGIGNKTYKEITTFLEQRGCKTVTALVKDDNVSSWRLFEKNGYHPITFLQMIKNYGVWGAIKLWFNSILAIAGGHHLWATVPEVKLSESNQIFFFLLINMFAFIPAFFFGGISVYDFGVRALAVCMLLLLPILTGKLATFFTKEKWTFRITRGGLLVSLIFSAIGGVFPMVGRFYPETYKNTKGFRRDMGIEAVGEWLGIFILLLVGILLKEQADFWKYVLGYGAGILLYHSIPIYPFECFGGRRIWDWNKGLLTILLLVAIGLIVFL